MDLSVEVGKGAGERNGLAVTSLFANEISLKLQIFRRPFVAPKLYAAKAIEP